MIYSYSAHLAGRICTECLHHFTNVHVILARSNEQECPDQPNIKQAFKQLTDEEFKQKYGQRLSEGTTDEDGNVGLPIDADKTDYSGGCLEVIVTLSGVPGREQKMPDEHYRIAFYDPQWVRTGAGAFHFADLILPVNIWCALLKKLGLWVICGQVNSCDKPVTPISNVTVKAYDVDWIQDDYLGSDVTDSSGWFLIVYDSSKFKQTPFSPFINVEWTGGPDVYFKIEGVDSDGNPVTLLDEDRSRGRQADRENVTNCFCTKLCVKVGPTGPVIADSAWTSIGTAFTIPDSTDLNDFDAAGYAGTLKYAFTSVTRMTGQSLQYVNNHPIEYRFLVSETTADNGTPFVPEANFTTVVGVGPGTNLFVTTKIAQMWRFTPTFKIVTIYAILADLDPDGWLDVNKSIERTFTDDPSLDPAELSVPGLWAFVDLDGMMAINTPQYINHANIPATAAGPGEVVPVADRLPIQKMSIRFETREVIDKATNNYVTLPGSGMTLNSMVVNNNPAFMKVAMLEHLTLGDCAPLSGDVHVVYTVCHPHLDDVTINVRKNSDPTATNLTAATVPPIPLINNTDTTLDHINNSAGIKVNDFLTMTKCTYIVKLHVRRRLHTGDSAVSSTHVDTSFYWEP